MSFARTTVRMVLGLVLLSGCRHPAAPPPPSPSRAHTSPSSEDRDRPIEATGPATAQADHPAPTADWTVVPEPSGMLRIRHRFADAVRGSVLMFGPAWQWAGPSPRDSSRFDDFTVDAARLPITLRGTIEQDADAIAVHLRVEVRKALRGISGVGYEFDLTDDPKLWQGLAPRASLDDASFEVPTGADDALEVRFDGPHPPRVYLERKDPKRVRVMLVEGDVPAGVYETTLHLRLPQGGRLGAPASARYAPVGENWWRNTIVWNDAAVDVKAILGEDRAAGSLGSVRAEGEALQFADGSPARFWGTNLAATSLFQGSDEAMCDQARRLSALGYNLVRLHHHDSTWFGTNVFGPQPTDSRRLHDPSLDRLDKWAQCLQAEGIYLWLDLHVGRQFAQPSLPGVEELTRHEAGAKGFNYLNRQVEAKMEEFAERYLERKNRYTGRRWKDDPAVVAILVTNENDLTDHFGNRFLPDKGNPVHQAMFERWARGAMKRMGLPPAARRIWEPGPGKLLLAQLQHEFDARALRHLEQLGATGLRATTNYWGRNRMYALLPLISGDLIDVHSYGDAEFLSDNPRFTSNYAHFIAGASVEGFPLTVSEWNVPPPAADRFIAPAWTAAVGSLQGWDALLLYAHSLGPVRAPTQLDTWSSWNDPALVALTPAAAIAYRRGDIARARQTIVLAPDAQTVTSGPNAETSRAIRTAAERHAVRIRLPNVPQFDWDDAARRPPHPGARVISDLDHDFAPEDDTQIASDTGELVRDWAKGLATIDTSRTQAAMGWIGGERIELSDATIELVTPKAALVLTSLDGAPLSSSRAILVSVVARAKPAPDGHSYLSEPVHGRFAIQNEHALGLVPLSASSRSRGVPPAGRAITKSAGRKNGWSQFELPGLATHWYLLTPSPAADPS